MRQAKKAFFSFEKEKNSLDSYLVAYQYYRIVMRYPKMNWESDETNQSLCLPQKDDRRPGYQEPGVSRFISMLTNRDGELINGSMLIVASENQQKRGGSTNYWA